MPISVNIKILKRKHTVPYAKTWTYLAAEDFPYGTLSAYVTGENQNSLARLRSYYSVNSKKFRNIFTFRRTQSGIIFRRFFLRHSRTVTL